MNTQQQFSLPYESDLTMLQVAASTLMTRFSVHGCPGLARAVVHHLHCLLAHPDTQASPVAAEGYGSLLRQWNVLLERSRESHAPQPGSGSQARFRPSVH